MSDVASQIAEGGVAQAVSAAGHFAAIIAASDDAILSKDREGVITSWNPAAERMYGYTEEEAVGQPISILIPRHRSGEERRILDQVLAGEHVEPLRDRARDQGRARRSWSRSAISPLRDEDGEIVERLGRSPATSPSATATLTLASRLQALTSALRKEITPPASARRCCSTRRSRRSARTPAAVGLRRRRGRPRSSWSGATGHTEAGLAGWQSFPLDADLPMAVAIRTGEGGLDHVRRGAARRASRRSRDRACVLLAGRDPARRSRAEPFGAVCAELQARRRSSTCEERAFLLAAAQQAAHTLERARLYEDQRQISRAARVPRRGERAARRLARSRRRPAQASPTSRSRGSPTGAASSWSARTGGCATSPSPTSTPSSDRARRASSASATRSTPSADRAFRT